MNNRIAEFLAQLHPYDQISQHSFDALKSVAQIQNFSNAQTIYQIGEPAKGLYIIMQGKVEIHDALGDVISILGKGNSFGERGLMSAQGQSVTQARAVTQTELAFVPADEFEKLRESEPEFARFFDRQSRVKRRQMGTQDLAVSPISQVMSAPVISVTSDCQIVKAANLMQDKQISALAVIDGEMLKGVLTLRDIVYKVVANPNPPVWVRDIMSSPAIALPADALVIDAMLEMARHKIGHLLVIDHGENGAVKGMVTQSNLVTRGANSVMGVLLEISRARSASEMIAPVKRLPELLAQMTGAGVDANIVTRLLTDIADAVTKRLIAIFQDQNGNAPAPFVWAACGSQGRQEQTGISDQDNCIIYADEVSDPSYFAALAKFVSDGMDEVGYFYCPGDMMATNPKWCQNHSTWRGYFADWVQRPTEEAQMLASVMFDLRAIDGDAQLLESLRRDVLASASQNSIFLAFLTSNSLKHQPPLSLFRGFSTIRDGAHKNTIDLKHSGIVPITDLARIYAIKAEITGVNTRARLQGAMLANVISEAGGNDLIAAYDFIQDIRLRHQSRQIRVGEKPDNFLNPSTLSDLERSHLRDAFVVVKTMQSALSRQSA